ncbi:hypothetical protein ANCCAN_01729 [Ancylostoma caninum]|uniref:SCP domain-containing protein n=1 Tax=Ancylostoma caninum TaxID=29170 RepID=A0A368H6T1_ANCCA|nr:hypothetical protein ANCCAN_01729 [Ancylostoma caninum]
MMISAGLVLAALHLCSTMADDVPRCENTEMKNMPCDPKTRALLIKHITAKMSGNSLTYDCRMEDGMYSSIASLGVKKYSVTEDFPGIVPIAQMAHFEMEPTTLEDSEEKEGLIKDVVKKWSPKLAETKTATKFGCNHLIEKVGPNFRHKIGCMFM